MPLAVVLYFAEHLDLPVSFLATQCNVADGFSFRILPHRGAQCSFGELEREVFLSSFGSSTK